MHIMSKKRCASLVRRKQGPENREQGTGTMDQTVWQQNEQNACNVSPWLDSCEVLVLELNSTLNS